MRESRQHGTVRGVSGNRHPYRDQPAFSRRFLRSGLELEPLRRFQEALQGQRFEMFRIRPFVGGGAKGRAKEGSKERDAALTVPANFVGRRAYDEPDPSFAAGC